MKKGKAFIFSAPSGSGKTTIVKHLFNCFPNLGFSISATTRPQRGTEVHGKDYFFLSPEEFDQKVKSNEFAEWEEVYPGTCYGTLKSEVERIWNENKHVVFDVDVIGGVNLKNYYKDQALAVFIKVPTLKLLEKRLRARQTDGEASIAKRLKKAEFELSFEDQFDAVIINNELDKALLDAEKLVSFFIDKDQALVGQQEKAFRN